MHVYLKWQYGEEQEKMMYFNTEAGSKYQKRALEKIKIEYLGQVESLKSVWSTFWESKQDMHGSIKCWHSILQSVLKMYKLYETQIDQQFLIEMIYMKNQKRK